MRAKHIAAAVDANELDQAKNLSSNPSPIMKMNEILQLSNLHFQIEHRNAGKLNAQRDGSEPYSIAELSDGERNALLIISSVLTAPENTLILLDEPERHLHRSIVTPLITTLLSCRGDCAFVISTHDISVPIDQPKCAALLLRQYKHNPQSWEADYIESLDEIDDTIASAVLGSRKVILFIEGQASSLDLQLYQLLFPAISIKAVGSCVEVEKIVKGIRASKGIHWVTAFGIIDKDNRSDEECNQLSNDGIIAIEQYSVESLYYHPDTVEAVCKRTSECHGNDAEATFYECKNKMLESIREHKDRMAVRFAERTVRDQLLRQAPSWKKISEISKEDEKKDKDVVINVSKKDILNILNKEKACIDSLIQKNDLVALVSRYPIRETQLSQKISDCLGDKSAQKYEQTVRTMITDNEEEKEKMLSLIQPVIDAIKSAN